MPLYDYRCTECGEVIEVMHSIDGTGPSACQACGGPMRKALSSPAIHFKGSGWAKKDAAAASAKKAKPKPTTSPSAKSGSNEKGSDSSGSGSGESVKSGSKSTSGGETSGATTSAKSD